jgi:hypothetical protein
MMDRKKIPSHLLTTIRRVDDELHKMIRQSAEFVIAEEAPDCWQSNPALLCHWMALFVEDAEFEQSNFILILIYLRRHQALQLAGSINYQNIFWLLTAAAIISHKWLTDDFFSNYFFAQELELPLKIINQAEVELFASLRNQMFVSAEEYIETCQNLDIDLEPDDNGWMFEPPGICRKPNLNHFFQACSLASSRDKVVYEPTLSPLKLAQ